MAYTPWHQWSLSPKRPPPQKLADPRGRGEKQKGGSLACTRASAPSQPAQPEWNAPGWPLPEFQSHTSPQGEVSGP
eukprot:8536037-Alexandrium_andersonii.AAC.1